MGTDPMMLVSTLIEAGHVDTVYRDVYLDRARTLLGPVLSLDEFHRLEQERATLAELPLSIGRALDKGNWPQVKELSRRAQTIKEAVDDKGKLLETARGVYAVADVRIDPLSPGLGTFTRVSANALAALRTRAIEQLSTLEQADLPWKDFNAERRAALQNRTRVTTAEMDAAAGTGAGDAADDLPWWWADASDNNTVDIAGLRPGQHKVKIELVDANHSLFPGQVVTLTFSVPDHDGAKAHSKPLR